MCGLVSVISKGTYGFTKDQCDIFSTLLFVDMLRGDDSTGAFTVLNNGDMLLAKEATDSPAFMRTKEYETLMRRAFSKGSALIGHNRKATRGFINDDNAHPFIVDDNIVLVHNGTLYGDHKRHADVEVDSHAIAHVLQDEQDVGKALSKIDGAYALIWYNVKDGTVNFVRNSMRPLWWMETPNSWIWSSEKSMLEFTKARHNLNCITEPTEFTPGFLQTYTLRRNGGWDSTNVELKIDKPVYQTNTYQGQQWVFGGQQQSNRRSSRYYEDMAWTSEVEDYCSIETPPFPQGGPVDETVVKPFVEHGTQPLSSLERKMAKASNKLTTNYDYQRSVVGSCHPGEKLLCEPFDYLESPFRDGYYLYASCVEDPTLIVKHFFRNNACSEERIIQIASGDYIYEFTVENIRWVPMEERQPGDPYLPDDQGFVLLGSSRAELIYGGGIGSRAEVHKRITVKH